MRFHINKRVIIAFTVILIVAGMFFLLRNSQDNLSNSSKIQNTMQILSPAFENNSPIPSLFTCDGEDVSPPLVISEVPEGAVSLVLIMEDPDVPQAIRADGMWNHWLKFDISPKLGQVAQGEEPDGVSGKGTAGNLTYHGPCPPDKKHRYFFKLYALDSVLGLPQGASKQQIVRSMEGHILDQAQMIGTYNRGE